MTRHKLRAIASWLAPLLGAAALAFPAAGCSSTARSETLSFDPPPSVKDPQGTTVRVSPRSRAYVVSQAVVLGADAPVVRAPARVAFRDGAVSRVDAPIAGRVTEVQVKVGDRVTAGQALVTLTSPDAAAARAALAAAIANHDAATKEAERQEHMEKSGVGVDSDLVAARAKLRESEAEVARARTTASLLGAGAGSVVVVRAAIDGMVIARRATVGGMAQPGGEPLIELGDPSALWVIADVFERDLSQVHEGAAAEVELPTRGAPAPGHVVSIGSALTGSLRTAPVYIALDDPVAEARPGMFARAGIKGPPGQSVVLPSEAVLLKDGRDTLVYVKAGEDTYAPRRVQIGPSLNGHVEILSGLAVSDQVVVKGALLLDGAAEQLL